MEWAAVARAPQLARLALLRQLHPRLRRLRQPQAQRLALVAGRAAVAVVAAGSWRQWVAMAKAVGVLGSITPLNSRTAC